MFKPYLIAAIVAAGIAAAPAAFASGYGPAPALRPRSSARRHRSAGRARRRSTPKRRNG